MGNTSLKYLGIHLTSKPESLYEYNYQPLFKKIETDLKNGIPNSFRGLAGPLSWKWWYCQDFYTYSTHYPWNYQSFYLKKLASIQRHFLWAKKLSRVQLSLLQLPKTKGGIGLPDFRRYYFATHLSRIIDWHCHDHYKDRVILEKSCSKLAIQYLPWTDPGQYPLNIKGHPLIHTTLKIFHKIAAKHKLSSPPSPLSSLANNPDFPPGQQKPSQRQHQ